MRRTRLAPESKKHRAKRKDRREVVEQAHERDEGCQFRSVAYNHGDQIIDDQTIILALLVPCVDQLDVHEIIPRSVYKDAELDLANTVVLCRFHHDWVGDHPALAHSIGLHGYSYEREPYCKTCGALPGRAHWAGCTGAGNP